METIIALLVAGAVLLALETVLPGLIAGIIGLGCLVSGVALAYLRFGAHTGNTILFIVGAGLAAGAFLYIKYFPTSPMARLFISKSVVGNVDAEQPALLHKTGTAVSTLRPSGKALIDGRPVDVITEGGFVDAGRPVQVIAIEGLRVVVRGL